MNGHASDNAKPVIIVVEDDSFTRIAVCLAFEDAGFEVIDADNADEALEALRGRARDVRAMFTDVELGGPVDGISLAHTSHDCWPWIEILIVSGCAHPTPAELPERARFLSKPYDPDYVIEQMREMIDA